MANPNCLVKGVEIENAKEDLRGAEKVEQYRLGKAALYLPRGFQWDYIPFEAILKAEPARRVVTAGHCVTVREEKPAVDLTTADTTITLNLEKPGSVQKILDAIPEKEENK
jgi:hypothetical protein